MLNHKLSDPELRSADYVAPHAAAGSIVAEVERSWVCEDGPAFPFVEWETGVGIHTWRGRADYQAWSFGAPLIHRHYGLRIPQLGHKSLAAIVDWFPDALRQWLILENELRAENSDMHPDGPIASETHKLLWRVRPAVEWDEKIAAWIFYARFTFVPKDASLTWWDVVAKDQK